MLCSSVQASDLSISRNVEETSSFFKLVVRLKFVREPYFKAPYQTTTASTSTLDSNDLKKLGLWGALAVAYGFFGVMIGAGTQWASSIEAFKVLVGMIMIMLLRNSLVRLCWAGLVPLEMVLRLNFAGL
ncbi:hypothetical protein HS088_TW04G00767 [Tripterygium wilfordii]|uniref:Uncharacterized protein n=1 Tax=Tripterygium wilfordii TaxID=458696 RepID=A0A7J7DR68_TRIWF|nr:hypothetical protein HS088_TW04G00767 [Tripterygium wilfordii]